MGSVVINSGGLGGFFLSLNDPGAANACGLTWAGYLADPECWGNSWSDWQNAFYGVTAAVPGTTVTAGPAAPTAAQIAAATTPDEMNALVASLVAGQGQAQQSVDAAYVDQTSSNMPNTTPDACATTSASWPWPFSDMSCSSMAIAAAAVFAGIVILGGRR